MVIIACEGKSDQEFLEYLRQELGLDKPTYYIFEGKDNLFNISHVYYNEIAKQYLSKLTKMLLIVDADNPKDPNPNRGYEATEEKLQEVINDLDFNDVEIKYYIMCDENKEGYLESLLISVLEDEQKECVKQFTDCYKYELSDKWIYQALYKQKKEPFDFSHSNFEKLKNQLKWLFS